MPNNMRRGSELSNISETWDQNESKRPAENAPNSTETPGNAVPAANDLDETIKEEAAEYDMTNKEDRVLGGDRASVNDAESADDSGE